MLDRGLNMLRRPKCMCCIPVDTGSFIFGVFSSVVSGFGVVLLTLAQYWYTADHPISRPYDTPDDFVLDREQISDLIATYVGMMILYVCFLTSFVFSVFLCYGTNKRRSGFVKAYLIYGVVVTILMMLGAILYSWALKDIVGGSVVLIICGIYSMILLMVQRTHELIRAEKLQERAQLLPDPDLCMKA